MLKQINLGEIRRNTQAKHLQDAKSFIKFTLSEV